jgi:hypothetical protein
MTDKKLQLTMRSQSDLDVMMYEAKSTYLRIEYLGTSGNASYLTSCPKPPLPKSYQVSLPLVRGGEVKGLIQYPTRITCG